MIALRKSKAFLALVRSPVPPAVDVDRVSYDRRGITFAPDAITDGERVWLLDPGSGSLTGGALVTLGAARLKLGSDRVASLHTVYVAGAGGWVQVSLGPRERSARPAAPRCDGNLIGFSEGGFYCREPAVVGYDRVAISVRHPVGGADRRIELPVDVVRGTFDTSAYLGLSAGDRVRFELIGRGGSVARDFVFPHAPDRWRTYSLDELTRS